MAKEKLETLRHSLSHIMAMAVLELYPKTKLAIGPSIEDGFYYDFDFGKEKVGKDKLEKIEGKMKEIIKKDLKFEKSEIDINKALKKEKDYKKELVEELKKEGSKKASYYKLGDFSDLCKGPHIKSSGKADYNAFKLTKVAGAYWKGDEKNKMLTRIYGVAFENKKKLKEYLKNLEEAEKRDHRRLGKELNLLVYSKLVGSGLPLYTHKGSVVLKEIMEYSDELQKEIGYEEVYTPGINKADLFKVSGHYEKYMGDMFKVKSNYSKEEYFLKPMNCPQHAQLYASKKRSYRELPFRVADFSFLYRDEKPGEVGGLTRLRCFRQDDGHCFCREDQIKSEFKDILGIVKKAMKTYGMDYVIKLSLWDPKNPDKYLGDAKTWEKSQKIFEKILKEAKVNYEKEEGEAAIYGPKMDLVSKDSLGREWQLSTIQLDIIMAERFGLKYTDKNGKERTPIMIHRALVGSPERFLGILLEHYAGAFPVWLSPAQVKVVSVGRNHIKYCKKLAEELKENNIRVEVDDSNETVGKKIRGASKEKVPYILVIGDKEMKSGKLAVRERESKKINSISKNSFIKTLVDKIGKRN